MRVNSRPSISDTRPLVAGCEINPVQTTPFPPRQRLQMRLWRFVECTLFRWSPTGMRGYRRFLLRMFGARLAASSSVHNTARIECPWNLEMGVCASVGEDAWVYCLDRVVLGDYACVGQRVVLLTGTHNYNDPTFPLLTMPIIIGYGAWIAVGATVLPGVKIGALAVVGAASVVTRDLPEKMVCAGNPCRPIKSRVLKSKTQ